LIEYIVQPGDTLFKIAQRYNTTVERILALNNIPNPDMLTVGMKLRIDSPYSGATAGKEGEVGDPSISRFIGGLLFTLTTDRASYSSGKSVRLTLVKLNTDRAPKNLNYRTSQRFDFVALREGREVWRWSAGRNFTRETARVTLRSGQSQTFRANWNQRDNDGNLIEPGTVTIRGINMAEELRRRPISIDIQIRRRAPAPPIPPRPGICPAGNLLTNPGLEEWRNENTPVGWNGTNLIRTRLARSGNFAAELGAVHNEGATLIQSVSGFPGRLLRLRFWAREIEQRPSRGNFVLNATVFFYDAAGRFITRSDPVFNQDTIPQSYTLYNLTTGLSPAGTARAEVRFVFTPAPGNNNTVAIDDMDFRCI